MPAILDADRLRAAQRAALLSLCATVVVVAVKLTAAGISHSISVLSEALQSILDVLMSGFAVVTLRYAAQPPDHDHPYGHGKAELLIGAFQMLTVLATAIFILFAAYRRFLDPLPIAWDWGAGAMAFAAVVNTALSIHLGREARRISSPTLASEALHLRSDTLSSIGILIGLIAVGITGWYRLDAAFAAAFTLLAMIAASRHLMTVIQGLMDCSLPPRELMGIETTLDLHPEVRGYHNLRTRRIGPIRFIELHVMLDDTLSFPTAHEIAEQVENEIRDAVGGAVVTVHYEPHMAELAHQATEHA